MNEAERTAARQALRSVWDRLTEVERAIQARDWDRVESTFIDAAIELGAFQRIHITDS